MIKGWKNNPSWRNYFESRASADEQTMLMRRMVQVQEDNAAKTREHEERQRKHMEECHAEKLASGEIAGRITN